MFFKILILYMLILLILSTTQYLPMLFFPYIYVSIIIKNPYGIKITPSSRAYHPDIPIRLETHPSNKHQRKTTLYIHHTFYLSSLLSNTTLWSPQGLR